MNTTTPTRKYINEIDFINNTEKKLVLETWYRVCDGMDCYNETNIEPGEIFTSQKSTTGEWKVRYSYDDCPPHSSNIYLGKFRNTACAMGEFSWMYCDDFNIHREKPHVFSIQNIQKVEKNG